MGEPRIVNVGPASWMLYEDGEVTMADGFGATSGEESLVHEVARLQEENRRLREEGIRDAMHILFGECDFSYGWSDGGSNREAVVLYYPPGFVLPEPANDEGQTISRTAMADALTDALLPLVP